MSGRAGRAGRAGRGRRGRWVGTALAVLLASVLAACSGDDDSGSEADSGSSGAQAAELAAPAQDVAAGTAGGAPAGRVDPSQRAVVHRVELSVEVTDVAAAADRAAELARAAQGFLADESTTGGASAGSFATAQLTLRVPVGAYEQVVDELAALGEVGSRTRSAEDVTGQLVDVDSRIASQQRSLERLRTLLAEAQGIADVVALEGELARREADLESLQAQQAGLTDLADLATVTVTFATPGTTLAEEAGFLPGLRGGWDAFLASGVVVLTLAGLLLPFAAAAALVGVPLWLLLRTRRRAAAAQPAGPPPGLPPVLPPHPQEQHG